MMQKIKNWFSKAQNDDEYVVQLPVDRKDKFILTIDNIPVGHLYCKDGDWFFKYTEEFKLHSNKYHRIVGFPHLDKVYQSPTLWPFFKIRIPGLKQPEIIEILERENINKEDDVELLKRFGKKTIANPYQLSVG